MSANPSSLQAPALAGLPDLNKAATSTTAPQSTAGDSQSTATNNVLPSISLPKAGGAIRGMGETFSVDLLSGTGALTVPIRVSPGRSDFAPDLSLTYSSTISNGPFGMGWSLGLPSITRKTDKTIPEYRDQEESDTFILTGHDDLIPMLEYKAGRWTAKAPVLRTIDSIEYEIKQYRPRTEGLFSRIEKWTSADTGHIHWRTISKENTTNLFGTDIDSRIAEPGGSRIFSWLLSKSFDDKGNVVAYRYKHENSAGIDLGQASESNRSNDTRSVGRYIKRIKYGNIVSRLVEPDLSKAAWMFEVVFDYGEHDSNNPSSDDSGATWLCRNDPFSSYKSGFEIRTYRLCRRILMFHHFPNEGEIGTDYLVASTDFAYLEDQHKGGKTATFLANATYRGYERLTNGYVSQSLPPLEFQYSPATLHDEIKRIDLKSLENLPIGLDGSSYKFVDLDGEGITSILASSPNAWYYKPNTGHAQLGPLVVLDEKPSLDSDRFMDLNGNGQLDLVHLGGDAPGFFHRTTDKQWAPFTPFTELPNVDWSSPNLRFVDLTGDGRADVLISEEDVFSWYLSKGHNGFGDNQRWPTPLDDERGPRLVFSNSREEIHLTDMSGSGLPDIVRIRNSDIVYWPNLGYGRFGAKIVMDNAPCMDTEGCFDASRVRIADIDGSGTTDLLYLGSNGVQIYFNQAGNSFSEAAILRSFPQKNSHATVELVDLLGTGTSCLVWSTPLPDLAGHQLQYIDLMGGQKPHLLTSHVNNMGSETHMEYTTSTKLYLEDKAADTPWITRLPFPMHLVSRVKTVDRVSGNIFTSQYRYRHGYFDGVEREFGGFGYVEQLDTESLPALSALSSTNQDAAFHVPPVLTKSWYHTGIYFDGGVVSRHFTTEYYREPSGTGNGVLTNEQAEGMLLEDTILPTSIRLPNGTDIAFELLASECYDACRSLKGQILRQEVYALDGTEVQSLPYSVSERNYTIMAVQPEVGTKHAVFVSHQREVLEFNYERKLYTIGTLELPDPRVSHSVTLGTDEVGNVLEIASVAYGRRHKDKRSFVTEADQAKQSKILITYSTNTYTNDVSTDDVYRMRALAESKSYEVINSTPQQAMPMITNRFHFREVKKIVEGFADGAHDFPYEDVEASTVRNGEPHRRLLEHTQSLFRADDMSAALPFKTLQALALPYETYTKAFTDGLAKQVYVDSGKLASSELQTLLDETRYTRRDGEDGWWLPSGRVFYSPDPQHAASDELAFAKLHFFLPHRFRNPYHTDNMRTQSITWYDKYCLLPVEVRDPLNNRTIVGERGIDPTAPLESFGNNYRVLKPVLVMDPNRNRTTVKYDAMGMLAGSAVMGKPGEPDGDTMDVFKATLSNEEVSNFLANPEPLALSLLGSATNRVIYDVFAYFRTRDSQNPKPALAVTLARQLHGSDGGTRPVQLSFSYSDGFGRSIQQKGMAEPGPGPLRDPTTDDIVVVDGVPQTSSAISNPRWIASGWTIYNNKGAPVKQYEPFFTDRSSFEFAVKSGVGAISFYDPLEREIGQLNPDHTWTKEIFDAWSQESWDANDTAQIDPATDSHIGSFFRRLVPSEYMPTWSKQRDSGQLGPDEEKAAEKVINHQDTPGVTLFDTLSRPFAVMSHNKQQYSTPPTNPAPPSEEFHVTRMKLDIEGNHREIIDALGRVVRRTDLSMMGKSVHEVVMDAGERWMLHDVSGSLCHSWDSRKHRFRTTYDPLHRPALAYVSEAGGPEQLISRTVYGESTSDPDQSNLRMKPFQVFDQTGLVTTMYDFKGNLARSERQLAAEYRTTLDWSTEVSLETISPYKTTTIYDALNRAVALSTPDGSITYHQYNLSGLISKVRVEVRGDSDRTASVESVQYNAKGQRTQISYGNSSQTSFEYDPITFRMKRVRTARSNPTFTNDQLQDLTYTYDPVGNITHVKDSAQQSIFFRNQRVEPSNDYTYSAEYRLLEAMGREQLGQAGPIVPSPSQVTSDHPNQDNAMGTYLEQYVFDSVGNITLIKHDRSDATSQGWKRKYNYNDPSTIDSSQKGNRLSSTEVSGASQAYTYDEHGNMASMPSLSIMRWDYRDQLRATAQQVVGNGRSPETTWYTYDNSGNRVRKVTERQTAIDNPDRRILKERIYVDGCEIYRTYSGDGQTKTLERATLHLFVGSEPFALVETRIAGDEDGNPAQLTRYQLVNHLDSVQIELDDQSRIISYEEYSPFGTSTYRAARSRTEAAKRYGYTICERDEESGLSYHGARYYITWLARWASCDPVQDNAPRSLYAYGRGDPISNSDPGGTQDGKHKHTHNRKGVPKKNHSKPSSKPASKPSSKSKPASKAASTPSAPADGSAPASAPAAGPTGPPPPLRLPSTRAEGAAFVADVKSRLGSSTAVEFEDRGVHVVVMPLPTPSIVHNSGIFSKFTSSATAGDSPSSTDFVINGEIFNMDGTGQGRTIESGVNTYGNSSPGTFYFAWDKYTPPDPKTFAGPPLPKEMADRMQWKFGAGDPPAGSQVAMGGGKPMIINGLPYGDKNTYRAGTPKGLPDNGPPGAGNDQYLTQRSNRGFADLNDAGPTAGNTIMAMSSKDNLLIFMVHPYEQAPGISLVGMRDSLIAMGADNALAYDGGTSSTLVRDQTVVVSPSTRKEFQIPIGIRFRP